jgi:hypothetical protein
MTGLVLLLGLLGGLHAATWGAYKDSPFEGFHPRSFVRSVAVGAAVGLGLGAVVGPAPALLLLGLVYAGERLVTEWWKAFLREDPQGGYTIPMRFAVAGRPVDSRLRRYATGGAVLLVLVLLPVAVRLVEPDAPVAWVTVLVGGAGGWATAVGGAWKDAPIEGFSGWKVLRSPAVATAWAMLLRPLTDDWLLLVVAAGGLSVLVIETYKTFLTGGRPPGKFAGRPVRAVGPGIRRGCQVLHCLAYGALAAVVLGGPSAFVPVAASVAVAMLVTAHRAVSPAAAREPDADAELRRESA